MTISIAEWTCPECKTKNRETCNAWMYGSPIRQCKACRSEYLDRRFREVAIDGFDPRSNNPKWASMRSDWSSRVLYLEAE